MPTQYKNKILATLVCSTLLTACGGGGGGGSSTPTPITSRSSSNLETDMYGTYQAILSPLNSQVAGEVNGSLTLVREMNDFIAHVRFVGGPENASILHTQSVHIGSRCPTKSDDLNLDGFIDAEEGAKVYKEILIPLDDDLNSQWMGGGIYPLADAFGNYSYTQVAAYDKMIKDLQEEDINLTDDLVKLGPNKSMTAIGKVVMIFGVPNTTDLPETVAGRGRLSKFEALPIACGVIKKISHVPGEIDDDHTGISYTGTESPGGTGEDDGANFPTTHAGGDGNYGDDDDDTPFPAPTQPPTPGSGPIPGPAVEPPITA